MKQVSVLCETYLSGHGHLQVGLIGTLFSKTDVRVDRIVQSGGEPLSISQFSNTQIKKFTQLLREEANKI